LFNGTYGRNDITEELDNLLDQNRDLTGMYFLNYNMDHNDAEDDLRRLFAMIPTVRLYFPNANHLSELVLEDSNNPDGVHGVATVFQSMREANLPDLFTGFREFRRSIETLGKSKKRKDIVDAVRECTIRKYKLLMEIGPERFPPSPADCEARIEQIFKNYLAATNRRH
jgi:hypothetical protein